MSVRIIHGDCREILKTLPDKSVQSVVTSPPYFGLRDYGTASWTGGDVACDHSRDVAGGPKQTPGSGQQNGHASAANKLTRTSCAKCGATKMDSQIGLEPTPALYVAEMVAVFREIKRVLRDDGTVWLNIGDSYANDTKWGGSSGGKHAAKLHGNTGIGRGKKVTGFKAKDQMMIPARVAIALCDDGWYLRKDIIWCLSGGTRVYARTQKGEMPMTIKDMVRLDPATVQLWNGEKWTQVLGWNEAERPDVTYEIELRNGQRIGCTGNHEWPTQRGNVWTDQLHVAGGLFPPDVIQSCRLPEPEHPRRPFALDDELVGWFVGLYIAEGSQSDGTINIASHTKEESRFAMLRQIADAFDGYAAVHKTSENGCTVAINSPVLLGIIDAYVSGRIASDKHLASRCWQRSDAFLRAVLDGYLSGDGHWEADNRRWRLGFCTNDELVADLRTIGARLGITVRLRRTVHKFGGADFSGYEGEVRFVRSDHHGNRNDGEVIAVRESRARKFWDIGVADEPRLFALASGVLTHNSKPNPMPESCVDRPTSSHEHVFLLTKRPRYFYDAVAVQEEGIVPAGTLGAKGSEERSSQPGVNSRPPEYKVYTGTRNLRDVWTIATRPYPDAHFAVMPAELAETCIKAGTSEKGACPACGAPWARIATRDAVQPNVDPSNLDRFGNGKAGVHRKVGGQYQKWLDENPKHTTGWHPTCECVEYVCPTGCNVLDIADEKEIASTASAVPDVRDNVPPEQEGKRLLLPEVLSGPAQEAHPIGVSPVRNDVHADQLPPASMLETVRSEMVGCEPFNDKGMDDNKHRIQVVVTSGSPQCQQGWVCAGAQTGDGGADGEAASSDRSGSPHQRAEDGQPPRELRGSVKGQTRWTKKAKADDNLSALQCGIPDERQCSRCGAGLVAKPLDPRPCTVLDCFSGAGTTALVADRLGRRAIGIELNPDYAAMGRTRVEDDAPLFAEVSA